MHPDLSTKSGPKITPQAPKSWQEIAGITGFAVTLAALYVQVRAAASVLMTPLVLLLVGGRIGNLVSRRLFRT